MKDLKSKKAQDVILHSFDEFQKLALSFIPGGVVFDIILNFRSNLKQKRTIAFSESVKTSLEAISGKELHSDNFTNEDFIDIMESIMIKVQSTKSAYKLERYRNILINQIIQKPANNELIIKFIQLVEELSEVQLMVLAIIQKYRHKPTIRNIHEDLSSFTQNDLEINPDDFQFYMRELISLGFIEQFEVDSPLRSSGSLPPAWKDVYTKLNDNELEFNNSKIVYGISKMTEKLNQFVELEDQTNSSFNIHNL